jgi:putative lipoprotein (rSAM/lipoprotein system)
MKNLIILKRQLLKKVLLILGVCGAGLMTACAKYGTLVSTFYMNLKGTVKSKETSQVINGIQIEVINGNQAKGLTDTNGAFSINSEIVDLGDNTVNLHISDIDGVSNGSFLSKDTIITLTTNEKLAQLKENIDIKLVKNE